jgi:hypothetical protein
MKWEYQIVKVFMPYISQHSGTVPPAYLESMRALDQLGSAGWEAVCGFSSYRGEGQPMENFVLMRLQITK